MATEVVRAAEAGWTAVEAAFDGPGDAGGCWCQWFRMTGAAMDAAGPDRLRAALRTEVEAGVGGVVAREDGVTVGWCGAGPRDGYPRLRRSPLLRGLDVPDALWSVTCFVVPPAHRGRGVATALLDGAIAHARSAGAAVVEAYPVDTAARARTSASELYHGPLSLFERAGFEVVARPSASRAVVRLPLS